MSKSTTIVISIQPQRSLTDPDVEAFANLSGAENWEHFTVTKAPYALLLTEEQVDAIFTAVRAALEEHTPQLHREARGESKWATVPCTDPMCRGQSHGGRSFSVRIPADQLPGYMAGTVHAVCNECYCR